MSTRKITNISLADYRKFLKACGCNKTRTTGGHEFWSGKDLLREITVQSHINPVPAFIVKQGLRALGKTTKQMWEMIEG